MKLAINDTKHKPYIRYKLLTTSKSIIESLLKRSKCWGPSMIVFFNIDIPNPTNNPNNYLFK